MEVGISGRTQESIVTMDTGRVTIMKFDGSNYLIWATPLEALLQSRGLWKHVDGNVREPAEADTSHVKFIKVKNMVRTAIICSLESDYMAIEAAHGDPEVMSEKLAGMHKSKCTASVHTISNRLLNIKMERSASIRLFLNEICNIELQLAFSGKVIEEQDKKHEFLNGLRQEYHVKKTILQESYDTSFEKMVSMLETTEDELASKWKT